MTRVEWRDYTRTGPCQVCGARTWRQAHHVVRDQDLTSAQRYDVRNRVLVGLCCHPGHSQYGINDTRIPYALVPDAAREFAAEVLGEGPAENYFARYYR